MCGASRSPLASGARCVPRGRLCAILGWCGIRRVHIQQRLSANRGGGPSFRAGNERPRRDWYPTCSDESRLTIRPDGTGMRGPWGTRIPGAGTGSGRRQHARPVSAGRGGWLRNGHLARIVTPVEGRLGCAQIDGSGRAAAGPRCPRTRVPERAAGHTGPRSESAGLGVGGFSLALALSSPYPNTRSRIGPDRYAHNDEVAGGWLARERHR